MDLKTFKTAFTFSRRPVGEATDKKTSKPRGKNPPGARTKNEPQRRSQAALDKAIGYREEIGGPGFVYRSPKAVALPDTEDLRGQLRMAHDRILEAKAAYARALHDFQAIGPLPDSIINDKAFSEARKFFKLYKAR